MLRDDAFRPRLRLAWIPLAALVAVCASAEVRLPAVIASGMVLQQQTDAALWGWAAPSEKVRVQAGWLAGTVSTVADGAGTWRLRVPTPGAGGPYRITVAGENTITLEDVLVGEVWICGGQSNMEWTIGPVVGPGVAGFAELVQAADQPQIRLFEVPNVVAVAPASDCAGRWQVCTPETLPAFSAVGYFFGRELHEHLRVPIGLISSNWGGTPAEAWTSEETLRSVPELAQAFAAPLALVERERRDPGQLEAEQDKAQADWWRQVDAADELAQTQHWASPDYDDSAWESMDVPGSWAGALREFDGVVWFRSAVDIPAAWTGHPLTLELGPIDDFDDTFVNGRRVGGLHGQHDWDTPRQYELPPTSFNPGRNVVAVRAVDTGGPGGLHGLPEQLRLTTGREGDEVISLAGSWRYHVGPTARQLPPRPALVTIGPHTPTTLFSGMIAPLVPYAIRGVIWYQGESNRGNAELYRTLFPALITDWRARWEQGAFPFYYVQIAPYAYAGDQGEAAQVREAQRLALTTPHTGMAVTLDIGNPRDIHPGHKDEVGRRLALWARATTYGGPNLVYSGPLYRTMVVEDRGIRLQFDHVGGGLTSRDGGPLTHFLIAGADRVFLPATATIDGDDVLVSSDAISRPVAVRYAWGAADEPNLANRAGLPASSFRTDDWAADTVSFSRPPAGGE